MHKISIKENCSRLNTHISLAKEFHRWYGLYNVAESSFNFLYAAWRKSSNKIWRVEKFETFNVVEVEFF